LTNIAAYDSQKSTIEVEFVSMPLFCSKQAFVLQKNAFEKQFSIKIMKQQSTFLQYRF